MNTPVKPRWLPPLLAAVLWAPLQAADWQALLGNSPFGQTTATGPAAAPGDLEFRGVVQEEGQYLVNLYNPTTKTSQWVAVNGRAPGLEVKSYDAAGDKVQITQAGRTLTLPMKQSRVALLQAPNPVPAGTKGDNGDNPENGNREERRAELRARMENGGGPEANAGFRNLPPEAQAMIQEFRRRRSESAAAAGNQQPPQSLPANAQQQNAGRRQRQP